MREKDLMELKEGEALEVIEVSVHSKPRRLGESGISIPECEFNRIKTRIFTDGEIEKQDPETTQKIDEYYLGKKKYQSNVDTLKKKNLYFKNHSYVIVYVIASEWTTVGNVGGWFDFIKDVKIYLKDKKDKKALKNAKQVIERIRERNRSVNYQSLFNVLFAPSKPLKGFECTEISGNVYSLKQK